MEKLEPASGQALRYEPWDLENTSHSLYLSLTRLALIYFMCTAVPVAKMVLENAIQAHSRTDKDTGGKLGVNSGRGYTYPVNTTECVLMPCTLLSEKMPSSLL